MAQAADFAKLVPGFDFLQGLMNNAGSALPHMGQWIAPTLNPEELDKRIDELRTVQFWLEQNARMLAATIQALEVQRMTLSTLKTMNLPVADLAEAFKIRPPAAATPAPAPKPAARQRPAAGPADAATSPAAGPAGVVDPMLWWGALTKQFTDLAAKTLKDAAADGALNSAAAGPTPKKAAAAPARPVQRAAPSRRARPAR